MAFGIGGNIAEKIYDKNEKQIPKLVVHVHEEYPKHDWRKDEDGNVDEWSWEAGFCNGVACTRCHDVFCVHCDPDYDKYGPCVVDEDYCPTCGKSATLAPYCKWCGQKLDWSVESE